MDSVPNPPTTKPSCKQYSTHKTFLHFSNVCREKSVGVYASKEVLKPTQDSSFPNTDQKVEFFEDVLVKELQSLEEALLSKLFSAISSLKLAYIQLQQAHIPYDFKKFMRADQLVSSELDCLSQLQRLYLNKQKIKLKPKHSLLQEIQEQQGLLENLQSKLQGKDTKILRLIWELEELELKNAELEDEINRKTSPSEGVFPLNRKWTPIFFSEVFKLAYKSIHDFAKPLIGLMKASGWDLHQAANSIAGRVSYAEKSHKKFAFEAYLSRIMLSGSREDYFELNEFDHVMHYNDPFDSLLEDPNSSFGRFCRLKYLTAVPSKMEFSFFSNLDQRAFVLNGGHPRTPFYRAFVRMVRCLWAMQVIADTFPNIQMFSAKRGSKFSEEFMDSVVNSMMNNREDSFEVGLTVMPGFKIGNNVVPCKVYLCNVKAFDRAR